MQSRRWKNTISFTSEGLNATFLTNSSIRIIHASPNPTVASSQLWTLFCTWKNLQTTSKWVNYNCAFQLKYNWCKILKILWQKLTIQFFYKYGLVYREVLRAPFEVCPLAHQLKFNRISVNRFALAIADIISDSAPGVIHECPYTVSLCLLQGLQILKW